MSLKNGWIKNGWIKRQDTSLAVWEFFCSSERLLTLAYEGLTDMADPPFMRDFAWALYDEREHRGRHRWTFKAGSRKENLEEMKEFAERMLFNNDNGPLCGMEAD